LRQITRALGLPLPLSGTWHSWGQPNRVTRALDLPSQLATRKTAFTTGAYKHRSRPLG